MRVVPKSYEGFACEQRVLPNGECFQGVMEYRSGRAVRFHIPRDWRNTSKLYRALTRGTDAGDLLFRTAAVA
jgi:hypothetical protein